MEIVFLNASKGAAGRIRFGCTAIIACVILGVLTCGAVGVISFRAGSEFFSRQVRDNTQIATDFWQAEIVAQGKILRDLRTEVGAHLTALAGRVGLLDAHMTRLDAVADRLVMSAQFDPEEFQLDEPPALGGPDNKQESAPKWNTLLENIDWLDKEIELRADRLVALQTLLLEQDTRREMEPSGFPVHDSWISSGFGYRTHPVSGKREFHSGIDFPGRTGAEVYAVGAGIVTWSGTRWGYGNSIEINHGNGYITRYSHNKENLVKLGERVEKGQEIALLGSTGRSTGPHVHFEVVENGKLVDPRSFLARAEDYVF